MTNTQTYDVLDKILYFVDKEIRHAKSLNLEISIQNQFDDVYFDDLDLFIALVKFEMAYLVDIPDELFDYRFTFRQLAEAIVLLPKIPEAKADEFRSEKCKMLNQMVDRLKKEIRRIQKGHSVS